MTRRWMAMGASLLIAGILGACAGTDEGVSQATGGGAGGDASWAGGARFRSDDAAFGSEEAPAAMPGSLGGGSHGSAVALPAIGPSVIKTARIEIEVKVDTFQDAFDDANDIAVAHGGFVLSSETAGDDSKTGRLIIRVPSSEFERAMSDARALGAVKGEQVSGQDVSQEFVDLEARLRNYTAQEAVLLKLMDNAQSVTDTIRVQRELEDIQLQIERLRGRLRYLEDQTSFGTIAIEVREAGAVTPRPGTLVRAWRDAVSVFMAVVSGVIVAAGVVVPVGLMILIAALILRWLVPGLLRRPSSGAPGAAP